MKVRLLTLADHASTDAAGKLNVHGAGITRISAELPASFPLLAFLVQFQVEPEDIGRTHTTEIRITDPSGQQLGELDPRVLGPLERKGEPGEDQTYTVATMIAGLPLRTAGRHEFEVRLNGEVVASLGLLVMAQEGAEDGDDTESPSKS